MLSTRNPLQISRHIQTESERMEKYIPCNWEAKEGWSSNSHIRQNRPQNKEVYKRQGRTIHNDQGINTRGKYNNCKYLCTQHRRRQWHPSPVLLPGKSRGQRSLVGCSPWGRQSRTRLSDFTFTFHFHALEKEMATHSSVLAWRIPGTGKPGGLPSMGSHRVGHD